MHLVPTTLEQFLHGEQRFRTERHAVPWLALLAILTAAAVTYGLAMGSYGGVGLQAVYSAIKLPFLLLLTSLICLPSFYVLNALLGLRDDFAAACRGVLAAQAAVAVALASAAPVILLAYVSATSYRTSMLCNGMVFAAATLAGQAMLARHYRTLVQKDPRHVHARRAWSVLYVFVAIQLAWVLRPFVGSPGLDPQLLRADSWSNAYVVVSDLVLRALGTR